MHAGIYVSMPRIAATMKIGIGAKLGIGEYRFNAAYCSDNENVQLLSRRKGKRLVSMPRIAATMKIV